MFGRGSRVQVRMRCGTRTRRRRHDHRVPPSTLAAGPTGDAPGPSAFECRLTGLCPSPRSLSLSLSPLRASERGSRLPPFVRLFSLAFSGSPWAAREPAISPAQLSLALARLFFAARPGDRLNPPPNGGTGRDGQTEATGSTTRTDAPESRRHRRPPPKPVWPAGQPSSRAPAHHRSPEQSPHSLLPTKSKGIRKESSTDDDADYRQRLRMQPTFTST